jgi:Zn-dependent M28 family amino/carboxypeptidase
MPLKATMNANYEAATSTITSYNVAGVVPGKTRPAETVIYTAHHDHLGIGQPDANGDRIYNGAIDNATGISQLIEQGRAFARGPRPQRSVVFLAVGAEEKGLLGSEYYVANPLYPLGTTVGVINTDGGNVFGRARDFSISGSAKLELLDMLIAEGKRAGRSYFPEENVGAGYFFRSDHFPFAKRGVPAISFRRGNDFVVGGKTRGIALQEDYTAKRYHQPDDEYDPKWDFTGMVDDSILLHRLGQRLANGQMWPQWSQDSEFRAVRDRSAGDRAAPQAQPAADPPSGERG